MQIRTYNGETTEFEVSVQGYENLVALPALIDCHVHFRTPGQEHKEDWGSGARAALAGGVTTVCDMPNNAPGTTTATLLQAKKRLVSAQLAEAAIPLRHYFFIGATPNNEAELRRSVAQSVGIKLFMGSSTGDLLVHKTVDQERLFALAAELGLPLCLHAEDETTIRDNQAQIPHPKLADHSVIRSSLAAVRALSRAIELADRHQTTIYVLHTSTRGEMELIRDAKKSNVRIFAETTPHHLFLSTDDYARLGTKAQMNPPLRTRADQTAVWEAIHDGTMDTVATDHAPHTLQEKSVPYPNSPSGVPGIETMLPLLLDASSRGLLSLAQIAALTHRNPEKIFGLPTNTDWVIVDLDKTKMVENRFLKTKCGWSPFDSQVLRGWPVCTILEGRPYYF